MKKSLLAMLGLCLVSSTMLASNGEIIITNDEVIFTDGAKDVKFTGSTKHLGVAKFCVDSALTSTIISVNGTQFLAVNPTQETTALGEDALANNSSGIHNTAVGKNALNANTVGSCNTGVGADALLVNTAGDFNTALGEQALSANTTGTNNIGIGYQAGINLTTGADNIYIGATDGDPDEIGHIRIGDPEKTHCTFLHGVTGNMKSGASVVVVNTFGELGVSAGDVALDTGDLIVNGDLTVTDSTTLQGDVGIGGNLKVDGTTNFCGDVRILNMNDLTVTGSITVLEGIDVTGLATFNDDVCINGELTVKNNVKIVGGNDLTVTGSITVLEGIDVTGTSTFHADLDITGSVDIWGCVRVPTVFCKTVATDAAAVLIDPAGNLGTLVSSQRYKKDIESLTYEQTKLLDKLEQLNPVQFAYRSDPSCKTQYGFIAEEVKHIMPELVIHDANGEVQSVKYDQFAALLTLAFRDTRNTAYEQKVELLRQSDIINELERKVYDLSHELEKAKAIDNILNKLSPEKLKKLDELLA